MSPSVAEFFDMAIFLEETGEGVYGYWQTLFADYPIAEEGSTKEMVHLQMRKHVEKLNKVSPALIFGNDYKFIKAVR